MRTPDPAPSAPAVRLRYPLRALAVVTLAWLLFLTQLLLGMSFAALLVPVVPFFLFLIIGGACLLRSAHDYAASVARPVPAGAKLTAAEDAEVRLQENRPPARAA